MFCLSIDVSLLAPSARQIERHARDPFDLGRAIDHRVDGLFDSVCSDSLLFGLAEIDAAREFAHDDEVQPAHQLRQQTRRRLESRKDANRSNIRIEFEAAAQDEQGILGAFSQRLSVVFGKSHRAEQNSCAAFAELASLIGQRRFTLAQRPGADIGVLVLQIGANGREHAHGGARDLRPDAVTGQYRDDLRQDQYTVIRVVSVCGAGCGSGDASVSAWSVVPFVFGTARSSNARCVISRLRSSLLAFSADSSAR